MKKINNKLKRKINKNMGVNIYNFTLLFKKTQCEMISIKYGKYINF
jgi:hypothetical protein